VKKRDMLPNQLNCYYESLAKKSRTNLDTAVARIVDAKKRGGKVMLVIGSGPNLHEGVTTLIAEFEKKHKEVYSTEKLEPFFRTQLERAEKDLIAAQEKLRAFRNDNNVMEMEVERETLASDFSKGQRLLDQLEGVEDAVAAESEDLVDVEAGTGGVEPGEEVAEPREVDRGEEDHVSDRHELASRAPWCPPTKVGTPVARSTRSRKARASA